MRVRIKNLLLGWLALSWGFGCVNDAERAISPKADRKLSLIQKANRPEKTHRSEVVPDSVPPLSKVKCELPPMICKQDCDKLVLFSPSRGPGYIDLPMDGETEDNQYVSFIRRDLQMLVKYAAAYVECASRDWDFGSGEPIVFGDMSESDGGVPKTIDGRVAHQHGHRNGLDIDIAYYQIGTNNNHVRSICETRNSRGENRHHCTEKPVRLDVWRTALFIGTMFEHPRLRVVGVDGLAGLEIRIALTKLCEEGWLRSKSCENSRLAFESKDMRRGWFYYHYNHMHVSIGR